MLASGFCSKISYSGDYMLRVLTVKILYKNKLLDIGTWNHVVCDDKGLPSDMVSEKGWESGLNKTRTLLFSAAAQIIWM